MMMYDEEIRGKIIENYAKIRAIKEEQAVLLRELQQSCNHESVVEDYDENFPRRQCAVCLLQEDGPNYQKLISAHFQMEMRHIRGSRPALVQGFYF